jgi:hypothetical protein
MIESNVTARVHVNVVSPEEADNGNAALWCGNELMAVTVTQRGAPSAEHLAAY